MEKSEFVRWNTYERLYKLPRLQVPILSDLAAIEFQFAFSLWLQTLRSFWLAEFMNSK